MADNYETRIRDALRDLQAVEATLYDEKDNIEMELDAARDRQTEFETRFRLDIATIQERRENLQRAQARRENERLSEDELRPLMTPIQLLPRRRMTGSPVAPRSPPSRRLPPVLVVNSNEPASPPRTNRPRPAVTFGSFTPEATRTQPQAPQSPGEQASTARSSTEQQASAARPQVNGINGTHGTHGSSASVRRATNRDRESHYRQ